MLLTRLKTAYTKGSDIPGHVFWLNPNQVIIVTPHRGSTVVIKTVDGVCYTVDAQENRRAIIELIGADGLQEIVDKKEN